ncbi:PD-(D/E)XK nuclease family protein [Sulfuriflexus sp.]|uniref:PD-(D/E)XK nuclease family protein n=1 Tax=Sulfuriflexus sp. TaxID=2015443 RepID=UPI0028CDE5B7|nr:PD-(D/E)XK nuclease family protein [Sulfuriflexus sp.]MDT8403825.1 PD-(D/E)XK nuclease family protein [Sulfuriflexus sp.]
MPDQPIVGITLLPYNVDPLQHLCARLCSQYKAHWPDLSRVMILMPEGDARHRLNRLLIANSPTGAVLGPRQMSLHAFVQQHSPGDALCINLHARELLLVEALREHKPLYGKSNPWLLAENLLQLFDELNRQQCHLPDDYDAFTGALEQAYGFTPDACRQLAPLLNHEAELVYTLWRAWREQLAAEGFLDPHDDYGQRLANLHLPDDIEHCYLLGYERLIPAEAAWFGRAAKSGRASLYLQGQTGMAETDYHPDAVISSLLAALPDIPVSSQGQADGYSEALNTVYAQGGEPITMRAQHYAAQVKQSPVQGRLQILAASSQEQQALGIELQSRLWLAENTGQIGIVTQDRRLARRLRALFERAGIQIQDQSGWALSTTSAAAVLERWLECIEQDFDHLPLLDLLKSTLLIDEEQREKHLKTVYRFEQDIVLHENIASGLWRYRRQLDARHARLPEIWTREMSRSLHTLFDQLEHAASPLLALMGKKNLQPLTFIHALQESLQRLGLLEAFAEDAAGQRILSELEGMAHALSGRQLLMHWGELRSWLGRTMERYNFCPQSRQSRVQLLDMNSTALCRFDALILAAADQEHLPGRNEPSAFFNDAVRQALGLELSLVRQRQQFYRFRCLLEAAPQILLSYHGEQDGEAIAPSPWLAALQNFHQLAWNDRLEATLLERYLAAGYSGFNHTVPLPANAPLPAQPRVTCPSHLLPASLSASSYQQIIDCPYQFFAARCLKLKTSDEIRTALEKNDYGQRIHLCLQAFHSQVEGCPPPFAQAVNATNRQAAVQHLDDISRAVFARDLEDNFQHRGWLRRWQQTIPLYIHWQISREHNWRFSEAEYEGQAQLGKQSLQGRLDRLDRAVAGEHYAIIDYKTGAVPKQADVDSGEAVQLPFYALLLGEAIQRVEYLAIDKEVKSAVSLDGEWLDELRVQQAHRLTEIFEALHNGHAMPAWGDEKTCRYCDMQGLCRRDAWQQADQEVPA